MPFARPTLTELRAQVSGDISSSLPGADTLLRYSNLAIIGAVLAGMASGHYGYLDWIARQGVPFTATDEYLEGWAALKGVTRKPATAAAGSAAFTGTNGSVIPAGTLVQASGGVVYSTTVAATIAGGGVSVPVASTVTGVIGNAAAGTALTLEAAVLGVDPTAIAVAALAGGAEVESDADLRTRMLAAYAAPAQGGAAADYVDWALAAPGVTRAWVVANGMGPGTVLVLFMMDEVRAAQGGFPQGSNGVAAAEARDTPATGDQLLVADTIFADQPVTALIYAASPTQNMITLTIAGISGASTATRAAIAAAFANALQASAQPGSTTYISTIERAIAGVSGAAGFVITAIAASAGTISPAPIGNIISAAGALPVAGVITYV